MAKKITELPAAGGAITNLDLVPVVEDPSGTAATVQVPAGAMFEGISGYGAISVTGNSTGQTSISGATKVTQFDTDDPSSAAVTPDHSTDVLTLAYAGKWLVGFQCSFSGTASNEMFLQVYVDGSLKAGIACRHTLDGSGNVASASTIGVISTTSASLDLDLRVTPTGTADFVLEDGQLWAVYMGA